MLRGIRFIGALSIFGIALAAAAPASAAQSAQACHASLEAISESRAALDGLQQAVTNAKADRQTLTTRIAELDLAIAGSIGEPQSIETLRAQRKAVLGQIATIDELLPPIEAQANVLASEVEQAELGYIACIESSL